MSIGLSPEFVSTAVQPKFLQSGVSSCFSASFSGLCTDSRKISKDCLFVAITGEKFDGHTYIPQAIKTGAAGIFCLDAKAAELAPLYPHIHFFGVSDVQTAFRQLAGAWRRQLQIPVIAIAGANGKTTTKDLLSAILSGKYQRVLKTQGSQNGFLGIPMTLMELNGEPNSDHHAAVIEIGIDDLGAMKQHLELVNPTASVVTLIGPEHLHQLKTIENAAQEESLALIEVDLRNQMTALNLDDPWLAPLDSKLRSSKRWSYSLAQGQTLKTASLGQTVHGRLKSNTTLEIKSAELTFDLELPLPGRHNAQNLLAATTLALAHGLSPAQIRAGLAGFKASSGRSELRELPQGVRVICDYYNSSPVSCEAALKLLKDLSEKNPPSNSPLRRWVCFADMLELGADENRFHAELAKPIIDSGANHILLFGPRMKHLETALLAANFVSNGKGTLKHFDHQKDLIQALLSAVGPCDTVLIKGSHSMKMELVFQALQAAPTLEQK